MNNDDRLQPDDSIGFDSGDCLNVIIEPEGDNTIRPCRPELLKYMEAERDRLNRYLKDELTNGS